MPLASSFLDTETSRDRKYLNKFKKDTFNGMAQLNAYANQSGQGTFGALTDAESIYNWFDESGLEYSPFGFMAKPDQYEAPAGNGTLFDPGKAAEHTNAAYDRGLDTYTPYKEDRIGFNKMLDVLNGIGDAFDPSATINASNKAAAASLLTGQQSADSVARSYRDSLSPGSSGDVGARMLRAKALLPVMEQNASMKLDTAKYADNSKRDATKLAADLATQLGNLSLGYTKTLAQYNSDKHQNALGLAGIAQDQMRLDAESKRDARQDSYRYDLLNSQNRQAYMERVYGGLDHMNNLLQQSGAGKNYEQEMQAALGSATSPQEYWAAINGNGIMRPPTVKLTNLNYQKDSF